MMVWIKKAWAQKKVITFIYVVQFILALGLGVQIMQVIDASIGESLSLEKIANGFDRTVFEDFLQVHGSSISPLVGMLRWLIPVYLILSIFLHAGLISNLLKHRDDINHFISAGWRYFKPCFIISMIFLTGFILAIVILWGLFIMITGNPLTYFEDERLWFAWIAILVVLSSLIGLLGWWWAFCCKVSTIDKKTTSVQWSKGWSNFKNGMRAFLVVAGIFLIINLIVYFIYALLTNEQPANRWVPILLLFVAQQSFNYFRIFLRATFYTALLYHPLFPHHKET